MKRLLTVAVALILAVAMALPVSADDDDNWTQVLSYSTVNNSGSNYFVVNKTATVFLELPKRTYAVWIDMLVSTSDMDLQSVSSIWSGTATALTCKKVDSGLFRVYGRLSYHTYTQLTLQFNCAGIGYYELLSCRICSLTADGSVAQAGVVLTSSRETLQGGTAQILTIGADADLTAESLSYEAVITVKDAVKYDTLTIYGSVNYATINSIRATYQGIALEYSVNFIDVESAGAIWENSGYEVGMFGKYIYAINIDLSQINRSSEAYCLVYLGGDFNSLVGMEFNCQSAMGYVQVPDTSDASWWTRFTTFMTGLFSPYDPDAHDFGSSMESQAGQIQDAVDEMDQVTKPDVDDLDISLDAYLDDESMDSVNGVLGSIFSNDIVVTMLIIALTCAFASYALFGKK